MHRPRFYLRLAWQNLRGNARWTIFAILGVAAGVAAMVALRSLGLAINDALLLNLREVNRGDINVRSVSSGPFVFTVNQGAWESSVFSYGELERISDLVAQYDGRLTHYSVYNNVQLASFDAGAAGRPGIISSFFIDPRTFAISHEVRTDKPEEVPLSQLLAGEREVVVSRKLADALALQVSDPVRVSGSDQAYTVTGIVPDHSEANIRDLAAAFFGFAYFHRDQAQQLQLSPAPNQISILLPDGSAPETIRELGLALWATRAGIYSMTTTPDLLLRNAALAEFIERFVVLTGLVALLIGGVGIVNTMLVLTGRRTQEIAALKTFGLRRLQIAAIFGSEALLLGLAGSVTGMLAGFLLSLTVSSFGETLVQRPLTLRLYPEALLFGLGMGLAVTLVFGVLPVSIAARVRPAIILRPAQTHIPRASLAELAFALSVLLLVAGAITGQIIKPLLERSLAGGAPDATLAGVAFVAAVLATLGALTAVLWLLLWLVGRLPPGASIEMRLALVNLGARRLRSAVTLLALGIGVFALSIVSFLGLGARQVLRFRFAESLGGNVLVVPLVQQGIGQVLLDLLPDLQEEVRHNTQTGAFLARLQAVDDQALAGATAGPRLPLIVRETQKPDLRSGALIAGRDLTPADAGQPVLVLARGSPLESALRVGSLEALDIGPGSWLRLRVAGQTLELEVIGIVSSSSNAIVPGIGAAFLPAGLLDLNDSLARFNMLDVAPEQVDSVLGRLSAMPLLLAVDVTFLDDLVARLIEQMSALPTAVGLLSLAAAAVIMGNTVTLATLERRRQTGVLRALGLGRERVLRIMLLENLLLGLLGAGPGIALAAASQSLLTALGTGVPLPLPTEAHLLMLLLLLAVLLIAWLATLAGARSAINEPVAQVLRYE